MKSIQRLALVVIFLCLVGGAQVSAQTEDLNPNTQNPQTGSSSSLQPTRSGLQKGGEITTTTAKSQEDLLSSGALVVGDTKIEPSGTTSSSDNSQQTSAKKSPILLWSILVAIIGGFMFVTYRQFSFTSKRPRSK